MISFGTDVSLADLVLRELAACEVIRKHPHPNVVTYYGCIALDGRVAGLCFKRYRTDLMQKVNPDHLDKSTFVPEEDRIPARRTAARYLEGIAGGIRYLHSQGIVHNDLNPANVMIADDDTPVIIDFESSSSPGRALDRTKRTFGWFDPGVRVSREANALDALEELRIWPTGSSPDGFRCRDY